MSSRNYSGMEWWACCVLQLKHRRTARSAPNLHEQQPHQPHRRGTPVPEAQIYDLYSYFSPVMREGRNSWLRPPTSERRTRFSCCANAASTIRPALRSPTSWGHCAGAAGSSCRFGAITFNLRAFASNAVGPLQCLRTDMASTLELIDVHAVIWF